MFGEFHRSPAALPFLSLILFLLLFLFVLLHLLLLLLLFLFAALTRLAVVLFPLLCFGLVLGPVRARVLSWSFPLVSVSVLRDLLLSLRLLVFNLQIMLSERNTLEVTRHPAVLNEHLSLVLCMNPVRLTLLSVHNEESASRPQRVDSLIQLSRL